MHEDSDEWSDFIDETPPLHIPCVPLLTPHTLSTNQLISMLSAAVLPFQSTEMPDYVLSRANFNGKSTETPYSVLSAVVLSSESTGTPDSVLSRSDFNGKSTETLYSVLSAVVLPFESTEMPDYVLSIN